MIQPDRDQPARTIHLIDPDGFDAWMKGQPLRVRNALLAQGLKPTGYANAIIPGDTDDDWAAVTVVANTASLSSWCLAKLVETLPPGTYRLHGLEPGIAAYGWLMGQYCFDRYKPEKEAQEPRVLLTKQVNQIGPVVRDVRAIALVRDLVNTPASDMGPGEMEAAAARIAKSHHATMTVHKDRDLEKQFPLIHAVGQAAAKGREPRLIELNWGNPAHPLVAVIGKGVTFDTGGLDIKPGSAMALMKKDMGGAAHALALAGLIMDARLPVRLALYLPLAENSISGAAMRPGDVYRSRAGLTVEITNTDAEGRLVLADALHRAVEDRPELIVDFATLTGAARVALGPDLPATFSNDDALADLALASGRAADDQLWRLPLHKGYRDMLKSDIADMTNSPEGGFAGSITAALFLQRFVPDDIPWLHLDTFAWRPTARPGRPKGGDALGLRAVWGMLQSRFAKH